MAFIKYTKYCSQETLTKSLISQQKTEMHILMNVFKRPLSWLQEQDRSLYIDAVLRLNIRYGSSIDAQESLIWIYVIEGKFWYHDMLFQMSEYIKFTKYEAKHLKLDEKGVYVLLKDEDMTYLMAKKQMREKQLIRKFIKSDIFYLYYIQDHFLKEFASLSRIKKLNNNKILTWKDDVNSHKIGIVYKGVLSIQYTWKRTIQVCQITKGMFFTNQYIKDPIQQLSDFQPQPIQEDPSPLHKISYHNFKYISKSNDTILLIFNLRLINESPYNSNPQLKMNLKLQYEKYCNKLQRIIQFQDGSRLHRNKLSIKEEMKKKKDRDHFRSTMAFHFKEKDIRFSPILQAYAIIQIEKESPYSTIQSNLSQIPSPSKPYSNKIFANIAPNNIATNRPGNKLTRSKTMQEIQNNFNKELSNKRLIHNTWLEQTNKKKKVVKSFSTLSTLSLHQQQKQRFNKLIQDESSQVKEPEFFVPNQFVKRKLKIKYESLIQKMQKFDLSLKKTQNETVFQKMGRLQDYIDSRRIVKLNTIKQKHKLLRDRVIY